MALWKDIAGYEGRYMVSDEGEVYSLPKGGYVWKYYEGGNEE